MSDGRLSRRALLLAPGLLAFTRRLRAQPVVRPDTRIALPRDFGAHPEFRTEWWYVTGWLSTAAPGGAAAVETYGFQLTFFRSRTDLAADNTSRFAARQLVFAHAAVSDVQSGRLRHDQRIARAGFGIAEASTQDTALRLRGWTLERVANSGQRGDAGHHYRAAFDSSAQATRLALRLDPTQPVLQQGEAGYSRKGPDAAQASHYLSEPQLAASGTLTLDGRSLAVKGRAWLDHEWSEALLHPDAVGWDWIGMNLDDGGALTAFRLRRADGSALWAGGSFRARGDTAASSFAPEAVRFVPLAWWTSPATQARYPVRWRVETPAGRFEVRARFEAQELDASNSTGSVYWEGLSELLDAGGTRRLGRGYLEMTGYAGRMSF